ncbi:MAG: phosphoribosylformylglycinamidine cyclo-ligase [Candidatus Omnitrophota bacterium]
MRNKLTYKKSGVDVKKAARFVKAIKPIIAKTRGKIGGFGGMFAFPKGYKDPVLVSSTDGVGTKLKLAFLLNKHDSVGIDLVAMNVNDILATGAKPLLFLDYIATGKLKPLALTQAIKGVVRGCEIAGIALVGGETAEMPGFYKENEYDMAGFCVGAIERNKIIDGKNIKPGDVAIGLVSSGPHSNGYSLIRRVFSSKQLKKYARALLSPTRIYVKEVLALLGKYEIKAIAHITGGAFYEKLPRVLPRNISLKINKRSWAVPGIFRTIQKRGNIPEREMYSTFNMGIGMVLIVKKSDAKNIIRELKSRNLKSWIIGEAVKGNRKINIL